MNVDRPNNQVQVRFRGVCTCCTCTPEENTSTYAIQTSQYTYNCNEELFKKDVEDIIKYVKSTVNVYPDGQLDYEQVGRCLHDTNGLRAVKVLEDQNEIEVVHEVNGQHYVVVQSIDNSTEIQVHRVLPHNNVTEGWNEDIEGTIEYTKNNTQHTIHKYHLQNGNQRRYVAQHPPADHVGAGRGAVQGAGHGAVRGARHGAVAGAGNEDVGPAHHKQRDTHPERKVSPEKEFSPRKQPTSPIRKSRTSTQTDIALAAAKSAGPPPPSSTTNGSDDDSTVESTKLWESTAMKLPD